MPRQTLSMLGLLGAEELDFFLHQTLVNSPFFFIGSLGFVHITVEKLYVAVFRCDSNSQIMSTVSAPDSSLLPRAPALQVSLSDQAQGGGRGRGFII